ncbi:MAG: hypothetical protein K0R26_1922 [Bacteroidota bacterium]|jgi:hypothetical protein|nr:hypothetical protein [Bacteroidota bacterium]
MVITCTLFHVLPDKKPPFLGVVHNYEAQLIAGSTHKNLIHVTSPIDMQIEMAQDLNIKLLVSGMLYIYSYNNVLYNRDAFLKWVKEAAKHKTINFGMLYDKNGTPTLVNVEDTTTPFFFPIRSVLIIEASAKLFRYVAP